MHICSFADGAEAWTALSTLYEKVSCANCISIKHQLYGYVHDVRKPIQTYVTHITNLAAHLKAIGVTLTAIDIIDVLIFNLNPSYSIIASTLTTSKDEMFVAAVSGMLIDEEMRKEGMMEGVLNQGGDAMVSTLATHHAMAYCSFLTWPTGPHCLVLPSPCCPHCCFCRCILKVLFWFTVCLFVDVCILWSLVLCYGLVAGCSCWHWDKLFVCNFNTAWLGGECRIAHVKSEHQLYCQLLTCHGRPWWI